MRRLLVALALLGAGGGAVGAGYAAHSTASPVHCTTRVRTEPVSIGGATYTRVDAERTCGSRVVWHVERVR